ncbi:MAG: hypothetical protein ACRD3F_02410 [Acidobacteriaceae bacterium]
MSGLRGSQFRIVQKKSIAILKTNDLRNSILETKGLSPTGYEGVSGIAVKKMTLILKTKDLVEADPENKGLTKFDLENKGFIFCRV